MIDKLKRYAPPGMNVPQEVGTFFGLCLGVLAISLAYVLRLVGSINEMYYRTHGKRILFKDAQLPEFGQLIKGSFAGFIVILLFAIACCIYHYRYFSSESKSIYVMKRLSSPKELAIRCAGLPLIGVIAAAIVFTAVFFLYLALYKILPPEGFAHPVHAIDFVRAFIVW